MCVCCTPAVVYVVGCVRKQRENTLAQQANWGQGPCELVTYLRSVNVEGRCIISYFKTRVCKPITVIFLFYHSLRSDLSRLIDSFILATVRTRPALAQGCAKILNIFAAKGAWEVAPNSGLYLPKLTCSLKPSSSWNSTHHLGLIRPIIREDAGKVIGKCMGTLFHHFQT